MHTAYEILLLFFLSFSQTIMEDLFIREHIEDLLRNIRTQVLIKLIRPYTRVRIDFVSTVSLYISVHSPS